MSELLLLAYNALSSLGIVDQKKQNNKKLSLENNARAQSKITLRLRRM